jgi:hypothetical protein
VGFAVGELAAGVGRIVGKAIGSGVGTVLGSSLGEGVGLLIGSALGEVVGLLTGAVVGLAVGPDEVGIGEFGPSILKIPAEAIVLIDLRAEIT